MKMTKKTYRRIRKTIMIARKLSLILSLVFILCGALAANGETLTAMLIAFGVALICFGISLFCDYLLGGYESPFYY